MYHQSSKRKQLLRRVAVYSLMTVAVVGLVTLLVFATLGYRFNQDDGLVQTGLVQFGSQPSGAQVTIDDMGFGSRTPSKTTLDTGSHTITMQRDGYHTWQKTVDVMGGAVLWLNYARLIPTDLQKTNVVDFSGLSGTAVSPDAKWMLAIEDATNPTLRLIDLTKDSISPTTLTLPANLYTAPAEGQSQQFELTNWDASSRFVTVKHTYGDRHEWLVVDTRDIGSSQNITQLLGVDASKLVFSNNSSSALYAQIGSVVRRIDRGSATLSRPLVENVADFSLYSDDVVIFTRTIDDKTGKRNVGYYRLSEDKTYSVGAYADQNGVMPRMAIGQYFGDTYMAVAHDNTVDIFTVDLSEPHQRKLLNEMDIPGGAQYLSTVIAGRFIIAQAGATYVVYDLELKKTTTTQLHGEGEVPRELRWLDGHMLWSDRGGNLRLYEFDGTNQHEIMKVASGFNVTLSSDGRYLYGITKSGDMFHLTRVKMIL